MDREASLREINIDFLSVAVEDRRRREVWLEENPLEGGRLHRSFKK